MRRSLYVRIWRLCGLTYKDDLHAERVNDIILNKHSTHHNKNVLSSYLIYCTFIHIFKNLDIFSHLHFISYMSCVLRFISLTDFYYSNNLLLFSGSKYRYSGVQQNLELSKSASCVDDWWPVCNISMTVIPWLYLNYRVLNILIACHNKMHYL